MKAMKAPEPPRDLPYYVGPLGEPFSDYIKSLGPLTHSEKILFSDDFLDRLNRGFFDQREDFSKVDQFCALKEVGFPIIVPEDLLIETLDPDFFKGKELK